MTPEQFNEYKQNRVKSANRLSQLGAPKELIEKELKFSRMTFSEYLYEKEREEKKQDALKRKFLSENKINKDIVDLIYKKSSELEYDSIASRVFTYFLYKIETLSFLTENEFHYGLYDAFLIHAHNLYQERYNTELEKDLVD